VTAAVDMMDTDGGSLYFLTAKGKGLYERLVRTEFAALTALKGADTMSCTAVSVRGRVRELGFDKIPDLLAKNPYMYQIYPTEESQKALTAFQIYEGSGEWFDLSKKPIERFSFTFGGAAEKKEGFYINDACIGCGNCLAVCPQNCIKSDELPYRIESEHCLHCGNCMQVCFFSAVRKK
jgi:ferredoxin